MGRAVSAQKSEGVNRPALPVPQKFGTYAKQGLDLFRPFLMRRGVEIDADNIGGTFGS